jgi:hypothetical protein
VPASVYVSCCPAGSGLGADLPCRVHDVLLPDRVLNVGDRETETGEPIGIQPHPHRVVGRAEVPDVADPLHAQERVVDVDERVVREKRRVVAASRANRAR